MKHMSFLSTNAQNFRTVHPTCQATRYCTTSIRSHPYTGNDSWQWMLADDCTLDPSRSLWHTGRAQSEEVPPRLNTMPPKEEEVPFFSGSGCDKHYYL